MRPLLRALLGIGLILSRWGPGWALDPTKPLSAFRVRNWTTLQGLPSNNITAVLQTRDGYLWVGTPQGLVRFDGVRFTVFTKENSSGLPNSFVTALYEDRAGTLWIGTDEGLAVRRGEGFASLRGPGGLRMDNVRTVVEGGDGTLWFSTVDGLVGYKEGRFSVVPGSKSARYLNNQRLVRLPSGEVMYGTPQGLFFVEPKGLRPLLTAEGVPEVSGSNLALSPDGGLWYTGPFGVAHREGAKATVYGPKEGLALNGVYSLSVDSHGAAWIGTLDGGLTRCWQGSLSSFPETSPLSDSITVTCEDHEGSLWCGTYNNGLCQLSQSAVTVLNRDSGLPYNAIRCLLQDRTGALWCGTTTHSLWRLKDGKIRTWGRKDGLQSLWVQTLAETPDGTLWIGTYGGGLYRVVGERLREVGGGKEARRWSSVRCLQADRRGRVWAGLGGMGIQVFEGDRLVQSFGPAEGLEELQVYALAEAADGVMYVGTIRGALYRVAEGQLRKMDFPKGAGPRKVLSMHVTPDGSVWILGSEEGLRRWKDGKLARLGPECGLPGETCFGAVADGRGQLWVRAQSIVYAVPLQELDAVAEGRATQVHPRVFGAQDEITAVGGPAQPILWPSADGWIQVAGAGGLASLDSRPRPPNSLPPKVRVEGMQVDQVQLAPPWSTSWVRGDATIDYTALSFLNPAKVRFQYRLDGHNPGWVDAGTRRTAYYTNLPPGRYTFRVKACNEDGVWNEAGTALAFELRPRFYQTRWFAALSALAGLAVLGALVRVRTRQLKARQRLLEAQVAERTRDLAAARDFAEAATRAKSEFLANMSHEIRTPMNAVLGFAGLGLKQEAPPKVRDYFAKIAAAGESLLGIINDILDFSKVEAGKLELEATPFDLDELLAHLKDLFAQRASEKGVAFRVARDPAAPVRLVGDPLRLGQVLINLTGNALKFTDQGQVRVAADRVEPGDPVRIRFSVEDSGIGMSSEQQARLFHAFSQADSSTTRKFGGTGLGLTISQRLVGLMGGEITARSERGKGSTFAFTVALPVAPERSGAHPAWKAPAPAATVGLEGARVLLAEDNVINQEVAREILHGFGLKVDIANNGLEAVRMVDHGRFDAVLMDVQMPEMDGYEATARIRERQVHAQLPIIAMTAHAMAGYRDECLAAGMNDYVTKPIDPEQLLKVLSAWTRVPEVPAKAPVPSEDPAAPLFDARLALRRLGGNQVLLDSLLQSFAQEQAGTLEQLRRCLEARDLVAAEAAAHALRGVAANLSLVRLQKVAGALEQAARSGDLAAAAAVLPDLGRVLDETLAEIATKA